MKPSLIFLALLFASVLLVAGCGGEQGSAPEKEEPTTSSPASPAPAAEPGGLDTSTLAITNSSGEMVEVEAEIADERAEQQRGLMERTALGDDAGMLFVFDGEQPRSFWMRNTLIPLSIAYIAADGRIVDIQDMQPLDETSHPSAAPAQYALEVNQGFFGEQGVELGDEVEIPAPQGNSG